MKTPAGTGARAGRALARGGERCTAGRWGVPAQGARLAGCRKARGAPARPRRAPLPPSFHLSLPPSIPPPGPGSHPSGKAAAAGAAGAAPAEPKLKPEGCAAAAGLLKEKSPAGWAPLAAGAALPKLKPPEEVAAGAEKEKPAVAAVVVAAGRAAPRLKAPPGAAAPKLNWLMARRRRGPSSGGRGGGWATARGGMSSPRPARARPRAFPLSAPIGQRGRHSRCRGFDWLFRCEGRGVLALLWGRGTRLRERSGVRDRGTPGRGGDRGHRAG